MSMVKMLSRKEWVVEGEAMLIHLTSSHHSSGGRLLAVLFDCALVSMCQLVICTVNLINGFCMCLNTGGGSSRGRRQRKGEDVVHPLKASLEDLYNGTSKKLSLSRSVLCSKCKG
jgi:DnaJ-class molecular chaperone